MQQIFAELKLDYELLSGNDELEITKKYNKEGKMYTYCIVGKPVKYNSEIRRRNIRVEYKFFTVVGTFHFYFIATITPSVINVFLYHIGTSENVNLTLPIPVNNVSNPGAIFYTLFIYQTIGIYISIYLGSACFTSHLLLIQHACCQLTLLRYAVTLETIYDFISFITMY